MKKVEQIIYIKSFFFFLLENLFHAKDLSKNEQEMLYICINEIEKIHFVQPKKKYDTFWNKRKTNDNYKICVPKTNSTTYG